MSKAGSEIERIVFELQQGAGVSYRRAVQTEDGFKKHMGRLTSQSKKAQQALSTLVEEIIGEDESTKKDAKLYSGYSDKDYDIIKVPNKSAIQRNKLRVKQRKRAAQLGFSSKGGENE